jgi:hypothetical protein
VTADESGLLWAIVSFGPSIISKMSAVTSTPRSGLAISASLPVRILVLSWWVVGTHPACLLRSFLRLGSVASTSSVVSLVSGSWALPREAYQRRCYHWLPASWRIITIIYFTGILLSAPPPLSTPTRCLSLCSAFIALQLETPNPPSTLPHRHRRYLHPLSLLLNPLSLPPSRLSDMHKFAIGVSDLPIAAEIDNCPIYLKAKLPRASKSTSSTRKVTQCNHGISICWKTVNPSYRKSNT